MATATATDHDAVQFFTPQHPKLARTTAARLREDAETIAGQIAAGACADWADYRYRCGRLQGLMDAIRQCEEVEREQNQ